MMYKKVTKYQLHFIMVGIQMYSVQAFLWTYIHSIFQVSFGPLVPKLFCIGTRPKRLL